MPADKLGRLMNWQEFLRPANAAAVEAAKHVEARGIKPGRIPNDGNADALADGGRTEYRRWCFRDPNINCNQRIEVIEHACSNERLA